MSEELKPLTDEEWDRLAVAIYRDDQATQQTSNEGSLIAVTDHLLATVRDLGPRIIITDEARELELDRWKQMPWHCTAPGPKTAPCGKCDGCRWHIGQLRAALDAAQSVVEVLEGALRRIVKTHDDALRINSTVTSAQISMAVIASRAIASAPSPEPTQSAMTTVVDGFTGRTMHVHDGTVYHPGYAGHCLGCFPPTQQEDGS